MNAILHRAAPVLALALTLSACSGGPQTATLPQAKAMKETTQFTIRWSNGAKASHARNRQFISPSAQSVRVDTMPVGSTDLSQHVTTIVNNTGSATSTVNIDAPIGYDTFTFSVYDQQNAQGVALGGATVTQTIAAGTTNVVKATLDGYVAALVLSSTDPRFIQSPAVANGLPIYAVVGTAAMTINVAPVDADGNVIVSGAPPITGSSDSSAFSLTQATSPSTAFTLQAVGPMPAGKAARITFTAPGATRTFSATYELTQIGLLYATAGSGASAHVYSYDTTGKGYTLPGSFPGLQTPIGIAYDAVNQRIYVADAGTSSILAYDLSGNAASGWTPPAVSQITGVAFSASMNRVLATSRAGSGSVLVFDKTGAAVPTPGFTGLHALPIGIADGAADTLIAVVEAGNPGYVDVFDTQGNQHPEFSSSLIDLDGNPFSPSGIGTATGALSSNGGFWISGTDGTDVMTAFYDPASGPLNGFFLFAPGYIGGTIDAQRGGPIKNPQSIAFNPGTGEFYVVDAGYGLRGFTCGTSPCESTNPTLVSLPEAALIAPPAGVSTFTAAAFAHF